MWRELRRIFTELGANADLRCVVLRGEGGNFAAGADIREFPRERADRDGVLNYHLQVIAPALHAIADCMPPVLAQIEVVCVGGGLDIRQDSRRVGKECVRTWRSRWSLYPP